ncbi:hypothetical protein CEP88_06250 [Roseobacter denitrificans]|uniref:DUF4034 domain-containing protein n=1 Tax=Roseobacter denitrificans (strain ATCC 33942 / OCh 114) TaxID=375451 RepID=Q163L3_ROSDO|nr:hypothetical protein [Roseobacter denitrificans]ABG32830.1 hypothetical protein RD1_3331 [Roseobacter denitrificans OCh 114]AVL52229.1 hypothetical protein CEP88_06250 [Roseobacter denitrificans]SFF95465.1 hypothetical protein SAMN05443635_104243 [Roseobacter denitrificans OCh 114]
MVLSTMLGFKDLFRPVRRAGSAPATPLDAQDDADARALDAITIPCPDPTEEERIRDAHQARGQFLARQEKWHRLSREMAVADLTRSITPAAMPVADLLCFGARADVVAAVEHAFMEGSPPRSAPLTEGIDALERMIASAPSDPYRAITVAQAHMDIGWAWRRSPGKRCGPPRNPPAFYTHFERARAILTPFAHLSDSSPLFHTTWCMLNAQSVSPPSRLARDYETLIDLNPLNPASMRALGTYLSPRWYGSHQDVEIQARRTAARTQNAWGAAGYAWVMFDTLADDPVACANLDVAFFIEGLEDILTRQTDQHTANLVAAYCARTIGAKRTGDPKADAVRTQITDCAHWIVRKHLKEVHAMVWAHAAHGFDNAMRVRSSRWFAAKGRQTALRTLAGLFRHDIARGQRITFTTDGPVVAEYRST